MCQHGVQGCCSVAGLRHGYRGLLRALARTSSASVSASQALLPLLRCFWPYCQALCSFWNCDALPAAATVRSRLVQATRAHKLLYSTVQMLVVVRVILCSQLDSFLFDLSQSWVYEIPYQVQSQQWVSTV